jgi:nucleotide-binding universal stress UspA family protein
MIGIGERSGVPGPNKWGDVMRILIGYNGSQASTAALYELRHAGLPDDTHALVLTVAEVWPSAKSGTDSERICADGADILRAQFPNWTVSSRTAAGSPPREILAMCESYEPDLIVVGEPRQSLDEHNIFIGKTSHTLLTEAPCSVRISRGSGIEVPHAERIIVGFDGSAGSERAVDTIAARQWPEGTDVRLLSVADSSVLGAIGRFTPQMADADVQSKFASQWAQSLGAASKQSLTRAGLSSSVKMLLGQAKDAIIEEAERWNADTIFVGPHRSGNSFERFLLGSVSAAVAARAHCSVEVVRC